MREIKANTPFQVSGDTVSIQLLTAGSPLQYCTVGDLNIWTDWEEALNVNETYVISNIPTGLYLRVPDSDIALSDK